MPPSDAPIDELSLLESTIRRLESRMSLGDDAELPALGALLLKYLERRAFVLEKLNPEPAKRPGSIAAATSRLASVGKRG